MAGNVKGNTIEFRGETTKLDKALRKVKDDSKGIDKELKQVNNSLKFNPKNTTLLAQKQTLLKQKIDATNGQLKELKSMQANLDAKGVDKNSEQYRKLEREIIETESKLKHFTSELQKTAAQASRIGQLGDKFQAVGGKMTAAANSMRGLSMAAAGVVASLGAITYKASANADDINTLSKQYSVSTRDLQKWSAAAELVDVDVTSITKANVKLKRNMTSAMKGTGDAADAFKKLGVNVQGGNGQMRDSNAVFDETIKALGSMTNETERDALALQIFGKSAAQLNPLIEDGGETYAKVANIFASNDLDFLSQEELDRANQFKDQIDTIKMVFEQAVNIIGGKLAGLLLPVAEKVQEAFTKIAGKVSNLSPQFYAVVGSIAAVVAAIAPVLLVFGHLSTAIGLSLSKLSLLIQKVPLLGKAFGFLKANPIFLVIAALVALALIINKTGMTADQLGAKIEGFIGKIVAMIPQVIATLTKMMGTIVNALVQALPMIVQGLVTLVNAIVNALPTIIPVLINGLLKVIQQIANALPTMIPVLLNGAIALFMALVKAIPTINKALLKALPSILKTLLSFFANMGKGVLKSVGSMVKNVISILGFSGLFGKVKGVFDKVKGAITKPIATARDTLSKIVGKIKGFFPLKMGKIFSGLKLPTIKASKGKAPWGIMGKGKAPKFSVSWHAQGGIFTKPTLLSDVNGGIHGLGENGAEAILPLTTLENMLNNMADSIVNGVAQVQGMGAVAGQPMVINLYASPNGQKLDEFIVDAYNRGSRRLGK